MASPWLSIVMPAYNESRRIVPTLAALRAWAAAAARPCELVFVDDGSRDGTADSVAHAELDPVVLRLIRGERNRGKGFAVRAGMRQAGGELCLMCDADLSAPLDQIERLLHWVSRGYEVVIGSRDMPDAQLAPAQPLRRRVPAWVFRALRRWLLLPELRDTQCGFKLFTASAARAIFARAALDGWLFDCEVLALAERLGYRTREVGVLWRNHPETRVRAWREVLGAVPTLLALRRRLDREFPPVRR